MFGDLLEFISLYLQQIFVDRKRIKSMFSFEIKNYFVKGLKYFKVNKFCYSKWIFKENMI